MKSPTVLANPQIQVTANKINGFRDLPAGWHFGEGTPPTDAIIGIALDLNREAGITGFPKTNAFPGVGGEIQVTAYYDSSYLEFTVEVNGTITFVREENDREVEYDAGLLVDEALQKIRTFKGLEWHSFDLSIIATGTPIYTGLRVLLSSLPVTTESQLSTRTAFTTAGTAFVSISDDSILTSPEYRQFFGKSQSNPSLKIAGSSR